MQESFNRVSEELKRGKLGSVMANTEKTSASPDGKEIGTREAGLILGFLDPGTIHRLCQLGEVNGGLAAWKKTTPKGNSPWRISLKSVLEFPDRQMKAALKEL